MRALYEQGYATVPLRLPRRPIVLTSSRNAKRRPMRGKENFPLSSDFTVLITFLPFSASGMSTNQNYLKNSKRNLASDSKCVVFLDSHFNKAEMIKKMNFALCQKVQNK